MVPTGEDAVIATAKRHPRVPLWRTATGRLGPFSLRLVDGFVVASGNGVMVLDEKTGRVRWQRTNAGNAAAVRPPYLFVADEAGGVQARTLVDGMVRWHARKLCPAQDKRGAVSLIEATRDDVFVGCSDLGRLIRLDRRNGRTRAFWTYGYAIRFTEIRVLSRNSIAVTVVTDGALLESHLMLLRRTDLHELIEAKPSAVVLGVLGSRVLINDACCFGRQDGPVSILQFDLADNSLSEPKNIPRDSGAMAGNGSSVALLGSHLYISTAPYIDDFGDPRAPSGHPKRLTGDLYEQALFLANAHALVRVKKQNGSVTSELLDLRTFPPRVMWRGRAEWIARYDARAAPETVLLSDSGPNQSGTVVLSVRDGRLMATSDPCGFIASDAQLIVAQCAVNHSLGYNAIEAFAVDR